MIMTGNPSFLGPCQVPLLAAADCDRVISVAEHAGGWNPAGVYDEGGQVIAPNQRSVCQVPLAGSERTWPIDLILAALASINDEVFRYQLDVIAAHDRPSILRYDQESADHFRSHTDVGAGAPNRKLTFIVQLSDPGDYLGCDLVLSEQGQVMTRERGMLIVFPSFAHHRVTPILRGRRYCIVGWVHGRTFD